MTTDIIEAARAAGVHPLAMSEEYLGGLERFAAVFREEQAARIYRLREEIMQQENEIERLTLNGIHSCHAECQRPVCRLTRERDAIRAAAQAVLDRWDSPTWEWVKQGPTAALMADLRAAIAKAEGEKK